VLGLQYLLDGGSSTTLNCGYGHGFSVREVLDTLARVSATPFPVTEAERRAGDPAELVADSGLIKQVLQWSPRHDDLELICRTAHAWERQLATRVSHIG